MTINKYKILNCDVESLSETLEDWTDQNFILIKEENVILSYNKIDLSRFTCWDDDYEEIDLEFEESQVEV